MPSYTYTTLAQVLAALGGRLYDATFQFWTQAELTIYLAEALRTWNAITAYWRGDFTFQSVQGQTWYDIPSLTGSLRPYTVLDTDLYASIEYSLLEPPLGVDPWMGSTQFSAADLLGAVTRRRDELLSLTGCTVARSTVPAVNGRIALADTTIDIRRIAYLPNPPGVNSVLWPADQWDEQSFNVLYTRLPAGTPGTPSVYMQSTEPPISFDVDTPPSWAGSYEVLSVNAGLALVAGTPSTLLVPDDWTHVIKWGALADLFARDGLAQDPARAAYCEGRYRMGAKLLAAAPALLQLRLGNVPLQVESVRLGDLYDTAWEAASPATPDRAFTSALNLLALAPVPNAGLGSPTVPYSLALTCVENAPIPVSPSDPVQVAREDLDAILDYVVHIAMLKSGGAEFASTQPLLQRFLQQAQLYNSKLSDLGEFTATLFSQSQREAQTNPVAAPVGDE